MQENMLLQVDSLSLLYIALSPPSPFPSLSFLLRTSFIPHTSLLPPSSLITAHYYSHLSISPCHHLRQNPVCMTVNKHYCSIAGATFHWHGNNSDVTNENQFTPKIAEHQRQGNSCATSHRFPYGSTLL